MQPCVGTITPLDKCARKHRAHTRACTRAFARRVSTDAGAARASVRREPPQGSPHPPSARGRVPARPPHLDLASGHLEGQLHQAAHRHAHRAGRVHLVPHRVTVHLRGGDTRQRGQASPGTPPTPMYSPRCPRTAAPRTSSG